MYQQSEQTGKKHTEAKRASVRQYGGIRNQGNTLADNREPTSTIWESPLQRRRWKMGANGWEGPLHNRPQQLPAADCWNKGLCLSSHRHQYTVRCARSGDFRYDAPRLSKVWT